MSEPTADDEVLATVELTGRRAPLMTVLALDAIRTVALVVIAIALVVIA